MNWLVYALILFSLVLVFSIGTQDESLSTLVGSGSLKLKWAMGLGGILAFLGVVFLSESVGETIGKNLLEDQVNYTMPMILSLVLGTVLWLLIATRTRVPISTTHTVVGAVFGISIIIALSQPELTFLEVINWWEMGKVIIGWILSPLFGYFGAWAGQWVIITYFKRHNKGFLEIEKHEKRFRLGIIFFACMNQISRAGNDSANALGILYGLNRSQEIATPLLNILILISGILFAFGLVFIGRNLVKAVGETAGKLRPSEALAIEASVAIILFIATLLGLPVSGGHILIFALIGSARMNGESPDRRQFQRMMRNWIITFPIAAVLTMFVYGILLLF